ncbi:MAG TPA: response regulator transcription factor [Vicinamibacterales bacterium]|nr:response regulator transcription factor [Vicinamibacterales bacterium]
MQLLLVEDDLKLSRFIKKGLTEESFTVDVVGAGEEALDRVRATAYDLIILDIMLPRMNGFAVCEKIRALGLDVPILMLSARGVVEDRVKGLETGADDYLSKPFSFAELSARVRALLRRQKPSALRPLHVSDLTLDPVSRVVKRGQQRIDLTAKEYALLEYLMRNAGQVLTRAMIAEHVWNFNWERLTNVIDVYVNHLRRKLEPHGTSRLIHAVRGVGYVLGEPDRGDHV